MTNAIAGRFPIVLCAILALMSSAPVCRADSEPVNTVFKETVEWDGLGSDQAPNVNEAQVLVTKGQLSEAQEKLKVATDAFKQIMTDEKATYVCFRSAAQFDAYAKDTEKEKGPAAARALVRVSYAFAKSVHLRAFIASADSRWPEALALLDQEIRAAPYESIGWREKGYVMNATRKHQEAITCYKKALELDAKHEGGAEDRAAAWRGIGFAETELGRLDAAKESYQESLKLEPGNKLALDEIAYIENLQKSSGKESTQQSSGQRVR
jgi:tetratricopeptide (TPR) repeat protein